MVDPIGIEPPSATSLRGESVRGRFDSPDCLCLFILGGNGGPNRDRTDDLLHAMQALSQLSYGPLPEFVKELIFQSRVGQYGILDGVSSQKERP